MITIYIILRGLIYTEDISIEVEWSLLWTQCLPGAPFGLCIWLSADWPLTPKFGENNWGAAARLRELRNWDLAGGLVITISWYFFLSRLILITKPNWGFVGLLPGLLYRSCYERGHAWRRKRRWITNRQGRVRCICCAKYLLPTGQHRLMEDKKGKVVSK